MESFVSQNVRRYSYNLSRKLIPFLLGTFLILISLIPTIGAIDALFSLPPETEPSEILFLALFPIPWLIFFGYSIMFLATLEPNIQVLDKGLKVQFIWFWWVFVPWEDVAEVKGALFGLSQAYLINVRKMTFIHRITGTSYGSYFKPAFLISPKINGFNELILTIKNRVE